MNHEQIVMSPSTRAIREQEFADAVRLLTRDHAFMGDVVGVYRDTEVVEQYRQNQPKKRKLE